MTYDPSYQPPAQPYPQQPGYPPSVPQQSYPQPYPGYSAPAPDHLMQQSTGTDYWSQQQPRPRRTWDVVLTVILLTLGAGSVLYFLFSYEASVPALRADPAVAGQSAEALESMLGIIATLLVAMIILWLITLVVSILLLAKRFIAFYVPIAGFVVWTVFSLIWIVSASVSLAAMYPGGLPS